MQRAKQLGIDAFALNIGVDPYTDTQLQLAYQSAANNDMKVFISFDFNWFQASDAARVGQMIARYGKNPAQLMVEGKIFASSFAGDLGDDKVSVPAIREAAGVDIFFAPNFHPDQTPDPTDIDGALNWAAWESNGKNKAPDASAHVTVGDGDATYQKWLGEKTYIAPVSAWFNTHYGAEVPYSKNWVFPSDLLWFNRWNEILTMGPKMIELVSYNDYGESHYLGPLNSTHADDGNSKWVNDMPHDGWLDMAQPFIAAFKDGAKSVDNYIHEDELFYWYRPHTNTLDCDSTDTTMNAVGANNASGNFFEGRPNGFHTMEDAVFVVTLLTAPGTVTVTSGNSAVTYNAPAGAFAKSVPMAVGSQSFALKRQGAPVFSGTSQRDVVEECPCGIYNFNAYVGSLPPKHWQGLKADALDALEKGLRVENCRPFPSITFSAPSATSYTAMGTATPVPSATASASTLVTMSTPTPTMIRTTHPHTHRPSSTSSSTASAPTPTPPAPLAVSSVTGLGAENNAEANAESCNAGTINALVSGNFLGLCSFGCARGYCPTSACTCTGTGTPEVTADSGVKGCPLTGLGDGYVGLCAFACARGYCPDKACTTTC